MKRLNSRTTAVFLLLFLGSVAVGVGSVNWYLQTVEPKCELSTTSIDFGPIAPYQRSERKIRVKNSGGTDLRVSQVIGSCICNDVNIDTLEIAPGKFGTLTVGVTGIGQPGRRDTEVVLITNSEPQLVRIPVRFRDADGVSWHPRQIDFGQVERDLLPIRSQVNLVFSDTALFKKLTSPTVRCDTEYVKTSVKVDSGRSTVGVTAWLSEGAPCGETSTIVELADTKSDLSFVSRLYAYIPCKSCFRPQPISFELSKDTRFNMTHQTLTLEPRVSIKDLTIAEIIVSPNLKDLVIVRANAVGPAVDISLSDEGLSRQVGQSQTNGWLQATVHFQGGRETINAPISIR